MIEIIFAASLVASIIVVVVFGWLVIRLVGWEDIKEML